MSIKKFIISFLFAMPFFNSAISQSDQRLAELRNVTPPSPNSSGLGKYGDWPVSLYTGLVNINIPLYELKGREGSVSVGISYHSSGIKVGEVASDIGLGWSLMQEA